MATTTATKAHAGGLGGALTVLVLFLLKQIPGYDSLPDDVVTAGQLIVTSMVTWLAVYLAPPNQ